jgi:hypothetical protein
MTGPIRDVLTDLRFGQRVAEDEGDDLAKYFVETDYWRRLLSDDVDVVYGPKGSGKSALYLLLLKRLDALFDRGIVLTTAENPRGAPAFKDLVTDPPASEQEFMGLWKLYFCCLLNEILVEYDIRTDDAQIVDATLRDAGLARGTRTLQGLLRAVADYARSVFRPSGIEAAVGIDPATQLPTSFKGKVLFREPTATAVDRGLVSVDQILARCNAALEAKGISAWVLLDRLDVAFADTPELEHNALRALFHVYLDLLAYRRMRIKVFLRTDIWRRITASGFREASHITRTMTISWNQSSLLNLVVSRSIQNRRVQDFYRVNSTAVLQSTATQEAFFYQLFPQQVDVGPNKPRSFEWMLSRTRDGAKQNAPRELIHFLNVLRDVQVRRIEIGTAVLDGSRLFDGASFKEALPEVSRVRLEQTLFAEYPALKLRIEQLRKGKTSQSRETLAEAWSVSIEEADRIAGELVDVGFFERRGSRDRAEYWVPFLYRDALDLVQGTAE